MKEDEKTKEENLKSKKTSGFSELYSIVWYVDGTGRDKTKRDGMEREQRCPRMETRRKEETEML